MEKQVKYFSFLFIFYVIKNFSEEMARGTSELIRRFCLFSFKRRSSSSSSTSTSDNSESEEERKVGTWPDWLVRIKLWQVTTWPWNSVIRLQSTLACGHPAIMDPPIIRTADKFRAKINCRHLTELNSRYYGLSLQRTLTQGPYSVRYKWSWLYSGLKIVTDTVINWLKILV